MPRELSEQERAELADKAEQAVAEILATGPVSGGCSEHRVPANDDGNCPICADDDLYAAWERRTAERSGPVVRRLADVQPERIEWLWPGYLARGKLHIIDGDPGMGKSGIGCDLAARISTGSPWPDGQPGVKAGVVIMSAEDGLADTIRPRLDAHGADSNRVVALTAVRVYDQDRDEITERLPAIDDLPAIRAAIEQVDAGLLILDPITAYLPPGTDEWKDSHMRRVLAPLARLAEELHVAVVIVRHLRKSGGRAIYAGGGSIGIIGAARVGFIVGQDPEDETRCVFAISKVNIAAKSPALAYRVVADELHGCARIQWHGVVTLTADDLTDPDPGQRSALDEAKEFLRDLLGSDQVPVKDVQDAAKEAGHSWATTRRAAEKLHVRKIHPDIKGPWLWTLVAQDAPQGAQHAQGSTPEHVEHLVSTLEPPESVKDYCTACGMTLPKHTKSCKEGKRS